MSCFFGGGMQDLLGEQSRIEDFTSYLISLIEYIKKLKLAEMYLLCT